MPEPFDDLVNRVRARSAEDDAAGGGDDPLHIPGLEVHRIVLVGLPDPAGDNRPPRLPPCADADVDAVELALDVTLPPLLRRLYTEVGNGGFGPGDGLVGVQGLVELHESYAVELAEEQELGVWPPGLLPFCQLDDTLIVCVDCSDPAGPIIGFEVDDIDFDEAEGFDEAFRARASSLEAWFEDWLAGGGG